MEMKTIILIVSCRDDADSGKNDVVRETWLRQWPDLIPHKFILGRGCQKTHDDELVFDVFDGFLNPEVEPMEGTSGKIQAALAWAVNQGYSHMFICFPDTYVHVPRLLASKYWKGHYIGNFLGHSNRFYAKGGAGYWLSAWCAEKLVAAGKPNHPSDDVWIGRWLTLNTQVHLYHDARYVDSNADSLRDDYGYPIEPFCADSNHNISIHLSELNYPAPYNTTLMHETHEKSKNANVDDSGVWREVCLTNEELYWLQLAAPQWTTRDLERITAAGYSVSKCQNLDLNPPTGQV